MNFRELIRTSIFGILFTPNPSGDVTSPEDGRIWYNAILGKFRKQQAGITSDLDTDTGAKLISVDVDTATYTTFAMDVSFRKYHLTGASPVTMELPPLDISSENIELLIFGGHLADTTLDGLGENLIVSTSKNNIELTSTTTYLIKSSYCRIIGVYGKGWFIIDEKNSGQLIKKMVDTSDTPPFIVDPLLQQTYHVVSGDPATFELVPITTSNANIPVYIFCQYRGGGQNSITTSGTDKIYYRDVEVSSMDIHSNLVILIPSTLGPYGSGIGHWRVLDIDWKTLLPAGGTVGQVLTKNSTTNYDVSWSTPSGGGGTVEIEAAIIGYQNREINY